MAVSVEERNKAVEAAHADYQKLKGLHPEAFDTVEAWWKAYYLKVGHKVLGKVVIGRELNTLMWEG